MATPHTAHLKVENIISEQLTDAQHQGCEVGDKEWHLLVLRALLSAHIVKTKGISVTVQLIAYKPTSCRGLTGI